MRRALAAAALLLSAALTGCSDEEPPPTASPEPCASVGPTVEVECAPSDAPTAPVDGSVPADSSAYPPLTLPGEPGQLAAAGNDRDPALRRQSMRVTVPGGARLRIRATCEGVGIIKVTTQPESAAELEFACGFEGEPNGITVEDSSQSATARPYTVSVDAPAPARWWVAVSSTTEPLPEEAG